MWPILIRSVVNFTSLTTVPMTNQWIKLICCAAFMCVSTFFTCAFLLLLRQIIVPGWSLSTFSTCLLLSILTRLPLNPLIYLFPCCLQLGFMSEVTSWLLQYMGHMLSNSVNPNIITGCLCNHHFLFTLCTN